MQLINEQEDERLHQCIDDVKILNLLAKHESGTHFKPNDCSSLGIQILEEAFHCRILEVTTCTKIHPAINNYIPSKRYNLYY